MTIEITVIFDVKCPCNHRLLNADVAQIQAVADLAAIDGGGEDVGVYAMSGPLGWQTECHHLIFALGSAECDVVAFGLVSHKVDGVVAIASDLVLVVHPYGLQGLVGLRAGYHAVGDVEEWTTSYDQLGWVELLGQRVNAVEIESHCSIERGLPHLGAIGKAYVDSHSERRYQADYVSELLADERLRASVAQIVGDGLADVEFAQSLYTSYGSDFSLVGAKMTIVNVCHNFCLFFVSFQPSADSRWLIARVNKKCFVCYWMMYEKIIVRK